MAVKAAVAAVAIGIASLSACNPFGSRDCGAPKSTVTVTPVRGDTAWGLVKAANPKLGCDRRSAVDQTVRLNPSGVRVGQPYTVGVWR
jgi:hypothetical protein